MPESLSREMACKSGSALFLSLKVNTNSIFLLHNDNIHGDHVVIIHKRKPLCVQKAHLLGPSKP